MDKFSYEANGYNRREVNKFVADVIKQTENVLNQIKQKDREIQDLKIELTHYMQIEETLKKAIYNAQEASDNIKRMAREEANITITDAKHNANRIINDALVRAEKIEMDTATLEKNMKVFKKKLKLIVEQQMVVVDEIENIDLE